MLRTRIRGCRPTTTPPKRSTSPTADRKPSPTDVRRRRGRPGPSTGPSSPTICRLGADLVERSVRWTNERCRWPAGSSESIDGPFDGPRSRRWPRWSVGWTTDARKSEPDAWARRVGLLGGPRTPEIGAGRNGRAALVRGADHRPGRWSRHAPRRALVRLLDHRP